LGQRLEARALVPDEVHSTIGGTVSALTPLGVALLGLRAGNRMPYFGLDGRLRTASVESIVSQPESQERDLRHRYHSSPYADPALRKGPATTRSDRAGSPKSPRPSDGANRHSAARPLPASTEAEPHAILSS
jgi:hypothetical protein